MLITKELILYIYNYIEIKDIQKRFEYLDEISKKLNINIDNLVSQIKEINSKNLYEEKKEKDLDFSIDTLKSLFNIFLEIYEACQKIKVSFILNEYSYYDLSRIKSIELKDYYISTACAQISSYKKVEFNVKDNLYFLKKEKSIDLYEMKIDFAQYEEYISDIMEIADNIIIVLFINFIFIFRIENNDFNRINFIKEKYYLLKCSKYDNKKIIVGSTSNLLIYQKNNDYSLQKVAKIRIWMNIINYYFFNKMIVINDKKCIKVFSIDKKFKLSNIKYDYVIKKYTRIKLCYMKKFDMFVLLEQYLSRQKLILTDFDKTYDEIIISYSSLNIQEFSKNDEFLVLYLEHFSKYKIENNKFKVIFMINIEKKNNIFKDNFHIFQISNDLYFITGMNACFIYKYNKNNEVKEIK